MCTISIYGLNTLTYELTVNENSDDGTMWCPIDVVTPIAGARNFLTLQGDQVKKPGFFGHGGIDLKMVLNFNLGP